MLVAHPALSGLRNRSGAGREYQDKAAQISVVCPLTSCTLKTPVGGGATVKTTRPTMSVVEGPGGLSVGKRIRTWCPVSICVCDPSGLNVMWNAAPLDLVENVLPVSRFVKLKAEPVPAWILRMTLPFLSVNSFTWLLPPEPSI